MELLKYIMKYIDQIKVRLLVGITVLGISMVISIIHPILMGKYIDSLSADGNSHYIIISVFLLVALWLVGAVISYLNALNSAHMSIRLTSVIRFHLLRHVERLPYATLAQTDTAYLNNRIYNDSSVLANFFLDSFLGAIAKTITCFIILGVIFFSTPTIGLLIIFLLPTHMAIYTYFSKKIKKRSEKAMESRDAFFGEMHKQLCHIRTIKLNVWYDRLYASLIRQFIPVYHTTIKSTQINALYSVFTQIAQIAANLAILLICGLAVGDGSMKLGSLITISSLFASLFSSFTSLMDFGRSYANACAAFGRVKELELAEEEQSGDIVPDKITEIEIKNLTFRYPKDTRTLIACTSIKFVSGKIYQIKGENGCGKSTFLNILLGLYKADGEIYFNGVPINMLNILSLRQKMISVVEQEPPLIFESILENMIDDDIDMRELMERIYGADLGLFVGTMDLMTNRILSRSDGLSGGEKQKVAIVRALLKNSEVLIFDEPTSALDAHSCNQLKKILHKLKEDRIIILVDHQSTFSDVVDEHYCFCLGKLSLEL